MGGISVDFQAPFIPPMSAISAPTESIKNQGRDARDKEIMRYNGFFNRTNVLNVNNQEVETDRRNNAVAFLAPPQH